MARQADTQTLDTAPSRDRVELILSHLDQLPTLPAVAARLLAVTTSGESSVRDAVEVIESDGAMTAAVLRMIRRADIGAPHEAMTVAKAVALLGFNTVRNLVLSVQVYESLAPDGDGCAASATRAELWKHALAVACTAEQLARRVGRTRAGGEAFVCGLLHDVGKIALDASLPKSYARVIDRVDRRRECICDVERAVLGLDHTVAGRRLLARWQLPDTIVDCAWLHHQAHDSLPSSVTDPALVQIVHLADNLVRRQRIGYSGYQHLADVDALADGLGIKHADLTTIAEQLPDRMEPFFEFLGLGELDGRRLYAASLAKANKELGQVNLELQESNRRLQTRSAVFEAVNRFTAALTGQDRVEDVCCAAAKSLHGMISTAQTSAPVGSQGHADVSSMANVLAVAEGTSPQCLHVGRSGHAAASNDASALSHVIDVGDLVELSGGDALIAGGVSPGIAPASERCEWIWQRVVGSTGPGTLWSLPFVSGDSVVGAALILTDERAIARFRTNVTECGALSCAMGLAIATARSRAQSERMTEELLELNRRCRTAEAEAVRTRSMSMIAAMAAGGAHELNNPLAVISGRAQMRLAQCDDPETRRTLEIIVEQTQQAAAIVMDLMEFAKPRAPEPTVQPLHQVFDALCQHWHEGSTLRADQFTRSLADESATVFADAQHLREMLHAIVTNAIEATPGETARLQINSPSRASDETVRIVIEDNGPGMPPDVLKHALDPFFSHRSAGRGRGLGLSRAYRLAEINGGRLWIESTPQTGTSVTVELPARAPGV